MLLLCYLERDTLYFLFAPLRIILEIHSQILDLGVYLYYSFDKGVFYGYQDYNR